MEDKKFVEDAVDACFKAGANAADRSRNESLNTTHVFRGMLKFLQDMGDIATFAMRTPKYGTIIMVPHPGEKPEDIMLMIKEDKVFFGNIELNIDPSEVNDISFKLVNKGLGDVKYSELALAVFALLDKYGITGSNYSGASAGVNLTLTEEDYKQVIVTPEITDISNKLKLAATANHRKCDIPDLILALFSDPTYKLAELFDLLGRQGSADQKEFDYKLPKPFTIAELYDDFLKLGHEFADKLNPPTNTIEELDKIDSLTNLNTWVKEKPVELFNTDLNIDKILVQLSSKKYNSIVLVGPSGCGKTSLVYELARRINAGECPDHLKDTLIYELSTTALVAGAKFVGEFEMKCEKIFKTVRKFKNVILFIDEGHMIMNTGSNQGEGGGQSLGNIIKPYIRRGDLTIISATTDGEYRHFEKDKAIASRFQKITIQEPADKVVKEMLVGYLQSESKMYGIDVENPDDLIDYVVRNGSKYIPDRANPDKSFCLIDGAFAYAVKEKLDTVNIKSFDDYVALKYEVFNSATKTEDTVNALRTALLGQEAPIARIKENLDICELGLTDPQAPLYSMILAGPTGTGKSETCKLIAKHFFGNENNLITINMSEYNDKMSASAILGSARGYVGSDEGSSLTIGIRNHPYSLVCFDEIEKADPMVFDTFLRVLSDGEIEDKHGNKLSFRNTIVVFTTNLGFTHDSNRKKGAGLIKEVDGARNVKAALEDKFSPEFLGRINDIITYNYLTNDIVEKLVTRLTNEYLQRAKRTDLHIEYSEDEIKEITKIANVQEDGARHLSQAVRRVLSRKILKQQEEALDAVGAK